MMLTISILSLVAASIFFLLSTGRARSAVLFGLSMTVLILGYVLFFISDFFTGEGITHGVIYHILHGEIASTNLIETYQVQLWGAIAAIGIYSVLLVFFFKARGRFSTSPIRFSFVLVFLTIAFLTHPAGHDLYTIYIKNTVAPTNIQAVLAANDVGEKKGDTTDYTAFETYYATDGITQTTERPNNLVLIYLEGVEMGYSDQALFGNLTPNLDRIAREYDTYTNVGQVREASYTIAGFVASQCGLPLMIVSHGNTGEGYKDSYMSKATCLAEQLKQYGYQTAYFGGAGLDFAGKRMFLSEHGYETIVGKDTLMHMNGLTEDDIHGWGVYDDILFETATDAIDNYIASEQPFLVSMLTLDTHPPIGYLSKACADAGVFQFETRVENATACNDYLVGELVTHIQSSPAADNTTIVIVSDHLTMKNKVSDRLLDTERRNRFHVIAPNNENKAYTTNGTTLDVGTTLLSYLGFDGRIGLGYDLRDKTNQNMINVVREIYYTWRPSILALWDFPTVTSGITIDETKKEVVMEGQTYLIPAIINVEQDYTSTVGFKKYLAPDHLFNVLLDQQPDTVSIIIDTCDIFVQREVIATDTYPAESLCTGVHIKGEVRYTQQLDRGTTHISQHQLTTWLAEAT